MKVFRVFARALAADVVAKRKYDRNAATFEESVGITGCASDSKEPRSSVYSFGGLGISKNDGTLF